MLPAIYTPVLYLYISWIISTYEIKHYYRVVSKRVNAFRNAFITVCNLLFIEHHHIWNNLLFI